MGALWACSRWSCLWSGQLSFGSVRKNIAWFSDEAGQRCADRAKSDDLGTRMSFLPLSYTEPAPKPRENLLLSPARPAMRVGKTLRRPLRNELSFAKMTSDVKIQGLRRSLEHCRRREARHLRSTNERNQYSRSTNRNGFAIDPGSPCAGTCPSRDVAPTAARPQPAGSPYTK